MEVAVYSLEKTIETPPLFPSRSHLYVLRHATCLPAYSITYREPLERLRRYIALPCRELSRRQLSFQLWKNNSISLSAYIWTPVTQIHRRHLSLHAQERERETAFFLWLDPQRHMPRWQGGRIDREMKVRRDDRQLSFVTPERERVRERMKRTLFQSWKISFTCEEKRERKPKHAKERTKESKPPTKT